MRPLLLFILLAAFACCPGLAPGQNRHYAAIVTDSETLQPLANVNVMIRGSVNGTKTDSRGFFSVSVEHGDILMFSHIAYERLELKIDDAVPAVIHLTKKVNQLATMTVIAPGPEDLIGKKPYFIIDYEFLGENLLMLGFDNSEFDARLFLADNDGSIINAIPVMRPEQLFRDCMGNVFLITKTSAYQIFTDGSEVELLYPVSRSDFFYVYDKLAGSTQDRFFLKNLYNNNKTLVYFNYDVADSTSSEMRVIEDKEAIQRSRWGGYFDGDEEDIDFQQRIISKPVYAPLMVIHDTINIFNYLESVLEKYLPDGTLKEAVPLEYGNDKQFRNEMCFDPETGKVYALFRKNGISSLKEVDRKTGKLLNSLTIPGYVFVDEIKVNNGNLFFLYRENATDGYKKLYRMRIDG